MSSPIKGKSISDKGTYMEKNLKAFLCANLNYENYMVNNTRGEYNYYSLGYKRIDCNLKF
jgi:hypothetical protein